MIADNRSLYIWIRTVRERGIFYLWYKGSNILAIFSIYVYNGGETKEKPMQAIFAVLIIMVISTDDGVKEFRRHSNGVAAYELINVTPCTTGLRPTGYSYAPAGSIMFKQKNLDGTVSKPVCKD